MDNSKIREHLISNGVRDVKAKGFLGVTKDNILTDEEYKEEFKFILIKEIGSEESFRDMTKDLLPEIF